MIGDKQKYDVFPNIFVISCYRWTRNTSCATREIHKTWEKELLIWPNYIMARKVAA